MMFLRKSKSRCTWRQRLGRWAAVCLAASCLAAGPASAQQKPQPPAMLSWLESKLVSYLEGMSGYRIRIGKTQGTMLGSLLYRQITLSDHRGVFARIGEIRFDWSARRLLSGEIQVNTLEARNVRILRLPEKRAVQPKPGDAPPKMPSRTVELPFVKTKIDLPLSLNIKQFSLKDVTLAPGVAGVATRFSVAGRAFVEDDGSVLDVDLKLTRHAGVAPEGHIRVSLPKKPRRLTIDIALRDQPGGLVTRALGLKARGSVAIKIAGKGSLDRWRGGFSAAAGDVAKIDGKISADAVATGHRVRFTASGASSLLRGKLAVFGDRLELEYDAIYNRKLVTITRLSVKGAPGEIVLSGRLPTDGDTLDLRVRVDAPELKKLAPLTGLPFAGKGAITARVYGRTSAPALDMTGSIGELRIDRLHARQAQLKLTFKPAKGAEFPWQGALDLSLTADTARVATTANPGAAFRPLAALNLKVQGALDWPGQKVDLKNLALVVDGARLQAAGKVDRLSPLQFSGTLRFNGTLPPELLYGARLERAAVAGQVTIDMGAKTGQARLTADVARMQTGNTAIDTLLAGSVGLKVAAAWTPDQVDVTALQLRARLMRLDGSGKLSASKGARFSVTARVPDLSPVSAALGRKISGSLNMDLGVSGTGAGYDAGIKASGDGLAVDRLKLGQVQLALRAAGLSADAGAIDFTMTAKGGAWPVYIKASARRLPRNRWRIAMPRGRLAGTRLAVAGVYSQDAGVFDGRIRLAAGALGRALRPLGIPVSGALNLVARLRSRGRVQSAYVVANGRRLRFAGTGMKRVRARLAIGNLRHTSGLTGTVSAWGIVSGGARISKLDARFRATRKGTAFTLAATPLWRSRPARISARGVMRRHGGWTRINLTTMAAQHQRNRITLTAPAEIRLGPGTLAVRNLRLGLGGRGQLTLDYLQQGGRIRGKAAIQRVQARLLALAGIGNPAHGQIDGAVTFSGTTWRPIIGFDIRAAGVRRAFAPAKAALNLAARGRLTAGALTADGSLGTVSSTRKLTFRVRSSKGRGGKTDAQISGEIDLAPVSNSGLFWAHRLSGILRANLTVISGAGAPQATGEIRVTGGRFEHAVTGAVLRDLTIVARGNGRRITLQTVTANDGTGGTISATGGLTVNAATGYPFDIRIDAQRIAIARREDLDITITGKVAISKAAKGPVSLRGDITVDKGELLIPEGSAPSIPRMKVVEIGGKVRRGRRVQTRGGVAPPMRLALNVIVPRRLFIRGRGVEVELRGQLRVFGTSAAPKVRGELRTVRGQVNILSKAFAITRGIIRFNNPSLANPSLDLLATGTGGGITATITGSGTARQPKFKFESSPTRPQDEILARLIFGKDPAEMTTPEALKLAAGAATLLGSGSGGVLNKLRRAAGLDVVDVTTDGAGNPRAVAGKYVTDKVLVKVEQGLTPESSAAGVEVEIRRNLRFDAKSGTDGRQRIGLKWRYDY